MREAEWAADGGNAVNMAAVVPTTAQVLQVVPIGVLLTPLNFKQLRGWLRPDQQAQALETLQSESGVPGKSADADCEFDAEQDAPGPKGRAPGP